METISSMAHTAAKAVWGDGTEQNEPASGVRGDVTKGEPYDGGNFGKFSNETSPRSQVGSIYLTIPQLRSRKRR